MGFGWEFWRGSVEVGPIPHCVLSGHVGDPMVEHLSESALQQARPEKGESNHGGNTAIAHIG